MRLPSRLLRPLGAALLLALVATGSILTFELRGRVPFSSDQSIIALIGLDILEQGKHPVFCYGSEYGGTLEPHLLAATFGLFGATPLVFRATLAALVVALVLAVWATTRRAFGEREALAAGLYLALGPSFFFYKGVTSDGAYTSLLLLSALALLFALRIDARLTRGDKATIDVLALGSLLGAAWWVHPLSIFLSVPIAVLALSGKWRAWLSPRHLGLLLAGFAVGDFPWWWHNARHGWASLKAPELAAATAAQGVDPLGERVAELFRLGWNIVLGGRSTWALSTSFPGSTLLAVALLATLLVFALREVRRGANGERRRNAAMFGSILLTVPLLNLSVARTDFIDPRYLLPTYLALAPLFGLALFAIRPRPLAGLLAAAALALNVGSQWTAPQLAGHEGGRFDVDGTRLVAQLEARGVDTVYASYWTAYRIAFLSRGKVAASPFGTETNSFVRDLALQARVDASAHPRFLLTGSDRRRLAELLERRGLPHQRATIGGYTLFSDLDEKTAEHLRGCRCIPAAASPGDIDWLDAKGPDRIRQNAAATYTVRFRTHLLMPLSNNVHLSYRWRPADGSASIEGGRVSIASKAMRGATVVLDLPVVANLPPGRHRLVIDLVDENVDWFEDLGLPPKALDVVVEP
ncbi:MAG TPA: glycosyltransferase family 39 protein [Thermoanaerobaculia bacterium]|nr:glycosyltransferase family 39 protein [Thermoanaerobaculia bacterium]